LVGLSSGLLGALLLHLVVNVKEAETGEDKSDKEEYDLEGDIAGFSERGLSLRQSLGSLV
jgi:hypothetical protein